MIVTLTPEEQAAFDKARVEHGRLFSDETFARLLIRDELIRMGLLSLPGSNRSRWAGGRRSQKNARS